MTGRLHATFLPFSMPLAHLNYSDTAALKFCCQQIVHDHSDFTVQLHWSPYSILPTLTPSMTVCLLKARDWSHLWAHFIVFLFYPALYVVFGPENWSVINDSPY